MDKEFIPYEQALELKNLGFHEPCVAVYDVINKEFRYHKYHEAINGLIHPIAIAVPTYSQVFRWFLNHPEWPVEVWIQPYISENPRQYLAKLWTRGWFDQIGVYKTYEEAELACLNKLIEIAKQ